MATRARSRSAVKLRVGSVVRPLCMAHRTDAIGRITRLEPGDFRDRPRVTVRLPNWQADGYHLDICTTVDQVVLEPGGVAAMEAAAARR